MEARLTNLNGVRILLVDDNRDILEVFKHYLEWIGAEVQTADCVEDALQCFKRHRTQIVVSDLNMPGQTGFQFIAKLRSTKSDGTIPAIAFSAYVDDETRRQALSYGFDKVLPKPIDPERLALSIHDSVRAMRNP
jgi:CheY-like chemotaxis protein